MRINLSRRAKLILGICVSFLVLSSGAIFGLAKTGVINIKMLASESTINYYLQPKYPSGTDLPVNTQVNVSRPGQSGLPPAYTLQMAGIDGFGNRLTKNLAIVSLLSNTAYDATVVCPSGNTSSSFRFTTSGELGQNFFTAMAFIPDCGATPPPVSGSYSLEGHIQSSSGFIANAWIALDGSSTVHATSDSGGYYRLDNIPFGTYEQLIAQSFSFSAVGYDSKNNQHFQNDLMINPAVIKSGSVTTVNVILSATTYKYSIAGSVVDEGNRQISDVTVKLLDASNNLIKQTTSNKTQEENYVIPEFNRSSIDNLHLEFSNANFQTLSIPLNSTTISGFRNSNGVTIQAMKPVTLHPKQVDLYYKLITDCTDPAPCPGINSLVDNIPIIIDTKSEQRSKNNFPLDGFSGVFRGVEFGQKNYYANQDSSTQPNGYYAPLNGTFDINSLPPQNISGNPSARVLVLVLKKFTGIRPQSTKLDIQGVVKVATSPAKDVKISVACLDAAGDCLAKIPPKNTTSTETLPANENSDYNYYLGDLYNIAQSDSGINQLSLSVAKQGYFVDLDLDGQQDADENGIITVSRSEIQPPRNVNGHSFLRRDFTLVKITESDIKISGRVLDQLNGQAIAATVTLESIDSKTGAETTIKSVASNPSYSMSGLKNLVDRNKEYWLVAKETQTPARHQVGYAKVTFSNTSDIVIDFRLSRTLGQVTFSGNVYNETTDGTIAPLQLAEVIATNSEDLRNKQFGSTLTDSNGAYEISKATEILTSETAPRKFKLTGYNGLSYNARRHKTYTFAIDMNVGANITLDFVFYNNETLDPPVTTRDVTIHLTQQTLKFLDVTNGSRPSKVATGAPAKLDGVKVHLESQASGDDAAGAIIQTQPAPTINGQVTFKGFPIRAAYVVVETDSAVYKLDPRSSLTLNGNDSDKTINYLMDIWNADTLKKAKQSMMQQQDNPKWGYFTIPQYTLANNKALASSGCCLTSLSMAIRYYYPRHKFGTSEMTPLILGRIANATGTASPRQFPDLARELNSRYDSDIEVSVIDQSQIDSMLARGIPVIVYSRGFPQHPSMHCMVFTDIAQYQYGVIDPHASIRNDSNSPYQTVTKNELGNIDVVLAVTSRRAMSEFRSISGHSMTSRNVALAAENGTASRASDYTVTANIKSNTASPVADNFIVLSRPGYSDITLKMNQSSGDSYSGTIPKHLINGNFSYKLLSVNMFNASSTSESIPVTVSTATLTPTQTIERAWSALKFNVVSTKGNTLLSPTVVATKISQALSAFRSAYSAFINRLGLRASSYVSVSGKVTNLRGELVGNIILRVWQNATLSSDGNFSLAQIKKGIVNVQVIDQKTGQNYTLVPGQNFEFNQSTSNLNIKVFDPAEAGTWSGQTYWSSDSAKTNPISAGSLRLYYGGQLQKRVNLTGDTFTLNNLMPLIYQVKYFDANGVEKTIINKYLTVRPGRLIRYDIIVNDKVTVSGSVTDRWSGSSVGSVVVLQDPSFTTGARQILYTSSAIQSDGSYSFSNVAPGSYYVAVKKDYRIMQSSPINYPNPITIDPATNIVDLNIQSYN